MLAVMEDEVKGKTDRELRLPSCIQLGIYEWAEKQMNMNQELEQGSGWVMLERGNTTYHWRR